MKFPHMNATDDQLWKWFKVPGDKTGAEFELKLITRRELQQLRTTSKNDDALYRKIANDYFRGFKGCVDVNGAEIPNTIANREVMLNDQDFGRWVLEQLMAVGGWRDEGKGDSGIAS